MKTFRLSGFLMISALASTLAAHASAASNRIFVQPDGIGTSGDSMGSLVALSGDTAAVGVPQGYMAPQSAPGAIAIFRNVGGWQREMILGPGLPSQFALQQDMLVVDGPHIETYLRNGTTWSEHDVFDVPPTLIIGIGVALSGETLLLAGNPAASVYERAGDAWTLQATLPGDQASEQIVSVALDGDIAAIVGNASRTFEVEAYVHFYHRSGQTWALEQTLDLGIEFPGQTVYLTAVSGQTVLVGATSQVQAYVRDQSGWSSQGALDPLVPYTLGSIAIDGDRAIIGSPTDNIPNLVGAGTAYVFERSGGSWARTLHLYDPDATNGAAFASSVALGGDTVIAGAPGAVTAAGQAGDASVIDLATQPWSKVATLDAGDAHAHEYFGSSLAASGETLVSAAPNADIVQFLPRGAAYVFGAAANGWVLQATLTAPATSPYGFASSVAAGTDTAVVGVPADDALGAVYVYTRGDGTWPQAARITLEDDGNYHAFGTTVALDGNYLAAGAPRSSGAVHVYAGSGSDWIEEAVIVPSVSSDDDYFGSSLALAGETIVAGAPFAADGIEIGAGLAFVFVRTGAGWIEQAELESPSPIEGAGFGSSVATHGDIAVVGSAYSAQGTQHAYVYERSGQTWTLNATLDLDSSDTQSYIASVAISPDESTIAIGMPTQLAGAGQIFTFVQENGGWVPSRTLVDDGPGNPGGIDGFGTGLAFLDENVLVGAPQDGAGGAIYEFGLGDPIFASGFDPVP